MKYKNISEGIFLSRPNRFIAHVLINGSEHVVHVKNTGRCKELLVPGCTVFLEKSDNPARKTLYDLVAVKKSDLLINMDSQAPNYAFGEWVSEMLPGRQISREVTYKDSRFDFLITNGERKIFTEVKGVTLEQDGAVYFPDAPTQRGVKHIYGLIDAVNNGYEGCIFFVIQMSSAKFFSPNYITHPEFGQALKEAQAAGVKIMAYTCDVGSDFMKIKEPVKIII